MLVSSADLSCSSFSTNEKRLIDCKSELISSRLLFISAKRGLLESTQRFTNMSVVLLFTC